MCARARTQNPTMAEALKKKLPFKPTALRRAAIPAPTPSAPGEAKENDTDNGVDELSLFRRSKEMESTLAADLERKRRRLQKKRDDEERRRSSLSEKRPREEAEENAVPPESPEILGDISSPRKDDAEQTADISIDSFHTAENNDPRYEPSDSVAAVYYFARALTVTTK